MSRDEEKLLANEIIELKGLIIKHIETFDEHVKKSDAHMEKMDPIVERIAQLTTVGDVITWTEKTKAWATWWGGFITPLVIIGGAIMALIKFMSIK